VGTPGLTAEADAILGAKLLVCDTCHGNNGRPKHPATPIIWGLQESYILKQMSDFQTGTRHNDVMEWMATALTPAELAPTAAYFAKKAWPARATNIAAPGTTPAGVAVCQVCHQQNLVGGLPAPRLAGQRYEYLVDAMRAYADGQRTNSPEMVNIMKALSAADRAAIARYISDL
jgi:cytochrome c553